MQETWVQSLGQEDPLEEGMATHSSIAWKIPWTEEPGGTQSVGLQSQTWLSMQQLPPGLSKAFMLHERAAKISLYKSLFLREQKMFLHSELFLLWLQIKWQKNKKMFNGIIDISTVIIVKADRPMIGRYMLHHLSDDF